MTQNVLPTGAMKVVSTALLFMLSSTGWAGWGHTWRDLTAVSPNSEYSLHALKRADADRPSYFAYRLHDRTGKTLWQRDERDGEVWPSAVFVADDAWSVLWLGLDDGKLLVVRPDGTSAAKLDIFGDLLTADERQKRVAHTSAGSNFGNRYCYVVSDRASSYFVMRTFWDRRVVVDLRQGRVVKTPAGLDTILNNDERKHVVSTLTGVDNAKRLQKLTWPDDESLFMAIHMAGRLKVRESTFLLRAVEAISYSTCSFQAHEFARDGRSSDYFWGAHEFRRAAQTALRHIGEKPRPIPAMTLDEVPTHGGLSWLKMPPKPRDQGVDALHMGQAPQEVIGLLGPPDDANCFQQWRYDMDTERPFTLILLWDEGKLKRIVKETSPVWQTEDRSVGDFSRSWVYEKGLAGKGSR